MADAGRFGAAVEGDDGFLDALVFDGGTGVLPEVLGPGTDEEGLAEVFWVVEVVEEGALWSPARIEDSDVGKQLLLATTSVTEENVDEFLQEQKKGEYQ